MIRVDLFKKIFVSNMQHIFFLFLIQYLIFDCTYHFINAKSLIDINIKLVNEIEFSSVACLFDTKKVSKVFCTGTFISYNHLLTTARCFIFSGEGGLIVKAGSHDLRFGEKYYPLWWVTYDQYIKIQQISQLHPDNDIGIIRLFNFVVEITPSPISQIIHNTLFGLKMKVIGCAVPDAGTIKLSMIKRKANLVVLQHNKCSTKAMKLRGENIPVPKYFLCTISKPYVLLQRIVSGGPLLFNGELIAINIAVSPTKNDVQNSEKINIHLSIEDYKEFIYFHLKLYSTIIFK